MLTISIFRPTLLFSIFFILSDILLRCLSKIRFRIDNASRFELPYISVLQALHSLQTFYFANKQTCSVNSSSQVRVQVECFWLCARVRVHVFSVQNFALVQMYIFQNPSIQDGV